ncbi:MAG: pilus assembly protein [Novosphingobium sp.]|nr:pilus assembly protein [Novosphingobium sp.]MCP5389385.1 pilus assembly protein [Novosphingobium sp.]
MNALQRFINCLRESTSGAMAIETALVAPILATLTLGGFEASRMVARNAELQSAIGEAEAIVMAAPPDTAAKRDTVRSIIKQTTGLDDTGVFLYPVYRCGTNSTRVLSDTLCASGDAVSTYIFINLSETYTPEWTHFGIGHPVNFSVSRTVQIS